MKKQEWEEGPSGVFEILLLNQGGRSDMEGKDVWAVESTVLERVVTLRLKEKHTGPDLLSGLQSEAYGVIY